jgi:DsbC/DsbD-like thiol-disulfide interchange protein
MAFLAGAAEPPSKDEHPAKKDESKARAKAALICEQTTLTPGSTVTIAITWELQPKWHMYWPGRNDTGEAPSIELELPKGFKADALRWPAPERHVEGEMLSHVYFNRLTVLAPLHVPAGAEPGSSVTLKAKLAWMICEETCVPEQSTVKLKIPIASSGEPAGRSPEAKLIEAARKRVPRDLEKDSKDVRISWPDKTVRIEVLGASHLAFYPDEDCLPLSHPIADGDIDGSIMLLRLDDAEKGRPALAGVLEIRRGKEEREWVHLHAVPGPMPWPGIPKNPDILPGSPTPTTPNPPTAPNPRPGPKPYP